MFSTQDGERLYLNSWNYNAMLILNEVGKLVTAAGGRVQPAKTAIITNRSVTSAKAEYSSKLEKLREADEHLQPNESRTEHINTLTAKLNVLEAIDNEPVEVPGRSWIKFVLDGMIYYLEMDDNPFFDFNYYKTPVSEDGEYSQDTCLDAFPKGWLADILLTYECTEDDRKRAADEVFNMLHKAEITPIVLSSKRIRVPNRYDGGYHYEDIYEKERIGRVDF